MQQPALRKPHHTLHSTYLYVSGAVCASALAKNGVSVTLFESARGPGGRMSQRREIGEDGKELCFDHGAPFFTVSSGDPHVLSLLDEWKAKGLLAEWNANFGAYDCISKKFLPFDQEASSKKYVGVPGMNSICRALCHEPGVESKFGVGVGRLEWLEDRNLWSVTGLDGQHLGHYEGLVASDKNIVFPRFTGVSGSPPPLDAKSIPELAAMLQEILVNPCFAVMLAFAEPLHLIPVKGILFKHSEILSCAFCDSSKIGRPVTGENWVLHSSAEYARGIISQTGLQKPSSATLTKVAHDLFHEFQSSGLAVPQPKFLKAHRWGSAFPAASIAKEEKCLWVKKKRVAICGDFCVSPNVEGAILSGIAASSKLSEIFGK
ncbi:hypothetical protein RJ641_034951 [Dillenia turbinata]|uniref:Amine oxidase domain-containing protein n=1 Tax=Dillenia turbinata TaxID=194707 RepID=A0AAN8VS42_9MAGN